MYTIIHLISIFFNYARVAFVLNKADWGSDEMPRLELRRCHYETVAYRYDMDAALKTMYSRLQDHHLVL